MNNEYTDDQESLNLDEDTVQETETEGEDELVKAKELVKNYKIRAEKAEKELKTFKVEKETPTKLVEKAETPKIAGDFSIKDIKALSDVHDDDVDEVVDYAKYKGISIAEAKKSPVINSLLKEKEELRKTSEATNTGSPKRSSSKISDEILLQQFEEGTLDESNIERVAKLRIEQKKNRK